MKALLAIAGKVQMGGKHVTGEDVERARSHGATDKEIHDTVLIAAAFCMFNRYVDGLDTWQPEDPEVYREIGRQTAELTTRPIPRRPRRLPCPPPWRAQYRTTTRTPAKTASPADPAGAVRDR